MEEKQSVTIYLPQDSSMQQDPNSPIIRGTSVFRSGQYNFGFSGPQKTEEVK